MQRDRVHASSAKANRVQQPNLQMHQNMPGHRPAEHAVSQRTDVPKNGGGFHPSQVIAAHNTRNSASSGDVQPLRLLVSDVVHPVSNGNAPVSKPRPAPKPKPAVKPRGPVVKALYPYEAQDTDELTFQEGQIIELVRKGKAQNMLHIS